MHNTKTRAVRPLKQAGFTLVELLIVVAIIGVLSAVAVPQYQKYVDRSEYATEFSELASYSTIVDAEIASGSEEGAAQTNIGADDDGKIDASENSLELSSYSFDDNTATLKTTNFEYAKEASGKWICTATSSDIDASLLPKKCNPKADDEKG